MIRKTKGIVLKALKYGESSIIATFYTEAMGVQSYLIKGIRNNKKKQLHATLFQMGMLLDLVVYHHPTKNLHTIKEAKTYAPSHYIHTSVIKNSIATFLIELILRTQTEPEENTTLYTMLEDSLFVLDHEMADAVANLPLYFSVQYVQLIGFGIENNFSEHKNCFDLKSGNFNEINNIATADLVLPHYAEKIALLLHPDFQYVKKVRLNKETRYELLMILIQYLKLHYTYYGELNSPAILKTIFTD